MSGIERAADHPLPPRARLDRERLLDLGEPVRVAVTIAAEHDRGFAAGNGEVGERALRDDQVGLVNVSGRSGDQVEPGPLVGLDDGDAAAGQQRTYEPVQAGGAGLVRWRVNDPAGIVTSVEVGQVAVEPAGDYQRPAGGRVLALPVAGDELRSHAPVGPVAQLGGGAVREHDVRDLPVERPGPVLALGQDQVAERRRRLLMPVVFECVREACRLAVVVDDREAQCG